MESEDRPRNQDMYRRDPSLLEAWPYSSFRLLFKIVRTKDSHNVPLTLRAAISEAVLSSEIGITFQLLFLQHGPFVSFSPGERYLLDTAHRRGPPTFADILFISFLTSFLKHLL